MFSGGHGGRGTPGPMPNPEVKPASADGTVWGTHGRVGRCQKTDLKAEEADVYQLPPPFCVLWSKIGVDCATLIAQLKSGVAQSLCG